MYVIYSAYYETVAGSKALFTEIRFYIFRDIKTVEVTNKEYCKYDGILN